MFGCLAAANSVTPLPELFRSPADLMVGLSRYLEVFFFFLFRASPSLFCFNPLQPKKHVFCLQVVRSKEQVLMRVLPTLSEVWKEGDPDVSASVSERVV